MVYIHAFVRTLEGNNPNLKIPRKYPKDKMNFLMEGSNMFAKYLGACLDSCRWGSQTSVMWDVGYKEMIKFIQNWINQNPNRFQTLFHEKDINEIYTKFELPHIHHEKCPTNSGHTERLIDFGGKVRCAHVDFKKLKPDFINDWFSYYNDNAKMKKVLFNEEEPYHSIPEDAWDEETGELSPIYEKEWYDHLENLEKFNNQKATEIITDPCYAIISDKNLILPLETILRRLNIAPESIRISHKREKCKNPEDLSPLAKEHYKITGMCMGHEVPNNKIVFNFDGWDLAFYVQRWFEQLPGDNFPPFFNKN